jgi:dienelactone hydrolase
MLFLLFLASGALAHSNGDLPLEKLEESLVEWPVYPATELTSHLFDYDFENVTYEGYVAYPTNVETANLPGVLIAHQYMGVGEMEYFRAREMASFGYVAFALDVYGKGNRPANTSEAAARISFLRANPEIYHPLMINSFELLQNLGEGPTVDSTRLFGNGYCAGGQLVLELARLGVPGLLAVAAFHPSLEPLLPMENYTQNLTAAVQAHHAELDYAGDEGLLMFEQEMRNRSVEHWTTSKYGNCRHGWTDPQSSVYRAMESYTSHGAMREQYKYILGNVDTVCENTAGKVVIEEGTAIGVGVALGVLAVVGFACFFHERRKNKANSGETASLL